MNICLFSEDEIARPLPLGDSRAEHILRVLHKKAGDTFAAGIIGKSAGEARITEISTKEGGGISFTFTPDGDGKPLHPLCMIIGFPRPIQLKRLLRDMASLGAAEVHLTGTELGEKSYLDSNLATGEAGRTMLLDGTVQAASTHVPELYRHKTLVGCLLHVQDAHPEARKLALDNVRPEASLSGWLCRNSGAVAQGFTVAAIGSERGWTDGERKALEAHGFTRLGLGSRILRTETAATCAASLILGSGGFLE